MKLFETKQGERIKELEHKYNSLAKVVKENISLECRCHEAYENYERDDPSCEYCNGDIDIIKELETGEICKT